MTAPEGTIPVTVPATVPVTPVPASGTFDVTATGSAPSLTFTQAGTDTGLGTFDSACTQAAGQNNTLAAVQISGGTTTEPTTTEPTTTTSSPGGGIATGTT